MSKLKNLMELFVVIEDDEDDDIPAEAADEDIEVAAEAARARAESGPVGREPSGRRVADYVDDPYAGSLGDADLSGATPDLQSENPFEEVYAAAGLPGTVSSHFTIYKVEKLLGSQHLAGLGEKAKAASVLVAMEANNVGLKDVIQDAVARDKALDQYDQMLRRDIKNLKSEVETMNAAIEMEIEQFLERKRVEIARNNEKLAQAEQLYSSWQERKVAEEQRLFAAVSPFTEQNPITRD